MNLLEVYGVARDNWRILTLTILLVVSGVALFVPGATGSDPGAGAAANDSPTNLQFGLELDGGTRIRAPVDGRTAEVQLDAGTEVPRDRIVDEVTNISGVERADVLVRVDRDQRSGQATLTVELFAHEEVTDEQFAAAIRRAGVDVTAADVREGVTDETRQEIVRTIRQKVNEAGFAGTEVSQTSSVEGRNFVVIESSNRNTTEIRRLLNSRGIVEIVARYPADNGSYVNRTVLNSEELQNARTGVATRDQRTGDTYVPITLTNETTARRFAKQLRDAGFTTRGVDNCRFRTNRQDSGYCLLTKRDGRVVYSASVAPGLAQELNSGQFKERASFRMLTNNFSEARQLQVDLRAGGLRAPLDFEEASSFTLAPALAERFKFNSLVTGIIAVLAVSAVVYFRYGNARIAAPMVVTALSEVAILLGFAAFVELQLNLSHIAGFIAVIGTGVDDLIIIADEVMSEGEVASARVFQSRFRKAFFVIGTAAATTIVAMSPLAILSLGDLRGFAIVTILGVLVGVLVTRPAYGDILRKLTTGR